MQEQQASGLISGGLFENAEGAKSNPPLLHTRLKEAAFCIARLSREKQQLIEMGNRLRAQITTAGLKGTITDTLTKEQALLLTPCVIKGTISLGSVIDHNSFVGFMGLLISNNNTVNWPGKICGFTNSLTKGY